MTAEGRVLIAGEATGPWRRLRAPISFWGGVDPERGTVADPAHPDFGCALRGLVLGIPETVGSSSSSAIMLELIRNEQAPAALVLGRVDPILTLGVMVGGELGYATLPVIWVPPPALVGWPEEGQGTVGADGRVRIVT